MTETFSSRSRIKNALFSGYELVSSTHHTSFYQPFLSTSWHTLSLAGKGNVSLSNNRPIVKLIWKLAKDGYLSGPLRKKEGEDMTNATNLAIASSVYHRPLITMSHYFHLYSAPGVGTHPEFSYAVFDNSNKIESSNGVLWV